MAEPIGAQLPRAGPNTRWADTRRRAPYVATRLKLMTVAEVSTEMRISKSNLYRMIKRGEIEAIPVGKRSYRVAEAEMARYLREGPRTDPSQRFTSRRA